MNTATHMLLLGVLFWVGCGEGTDSSKKGQEALQPTTCEEPVWVPKPCEEEFCENARCGAPDSYVDEFRCERKHCETNEDCGPDEECRWLRYLPPICKWETKEEKTCWCGFQLNVDAQLCLPKQ
ncbi:MAG: hypothetical protein BWY17_01607 [Deltaproteobacteria bacterium ADurb.Bin207]|nr:MAG: hypothetical protein BWY17_01607 [Deltaproteobacteria bacterium ADurb.Bin207]